MSILNENVDVSIKNTACVACGARMISIKGLPVRSKLNKYFNESIHWFKDFHIKNIVYFQKSNRLATVMCKDTSFRVGSKKFKVCYTHCSKCNNYF